MKNWKILSLIAGAFILAGSLFSCKDKSEVVVEPYGLYKAAVQSVTPLDKTVKKNFCDSLKKEMTAYLAALQASDTEMTYGNKTQPRFNEIVEEVANKYKDGYKDFPEGKYATVTLGMQSGSNVAYEAQIRIYGEKSEIVYPTISVVPQSCYEMVMPFVINENVEPGELEFITDSIKNEVLPLEWPKYGISKAQALELYDKAIAEQVKGLKVAETICPDDTMSLLFGFSLVYNHDVIVKSNEILVNNKGVTLVK